MALSAEALTRAGIRLSPAAFEALLRDLIEEAGRSREVATPDALPQAEASALRRAGLTVGPVPADAGDAVALMVAKYTVLLASSLSVAEAARLLKVDPSRIRQRLTERTLYGFKRGGEWRLPRFQFDEHGTVPGVEHVFPHLNPEHHPVEIESWFTLPSPDLELHDELISPRDWLRAGESPAVVAEIAANLIAS